MKNIPPRPLRDVNDDFGGLAVKHSRMRIAHAEIPLQIFGKTNLENDIFLNETSWVASRFILSSVTYNLKKSLNKNYPRTS